MNEVVHFRRNMFESDFLKTITGKNFQEQNFKSRKTLCS